MTADGRWSFVTLNSAVEVLSSRDGAPAVSARLGVPGVPQGEQLARDGRYLLVADDSGALMIDSLAVFDLQQGSPAALGPSDFVGTVPWLCLIFRDGNEGAFPVSRLT